MILVALGALIYAGVLAFVGSLCVAAKAGDAALEVDP